MKAHRAVVIAAVIVSTAIFIWLLRPNRRFEPRFIPEAGTNAALGPSVQRSNSALSEPGKSVAETNGVPTSVPTRTKVQEYVRGLTDLNHVEIAFYGKLEDQVGNPLP